VRRRRVVIWRHGQTGWNAEGRFQGQTDVDLDEVGCAQAQRSASLLAALRPHAIVSSDLRRAADTAAALGRVARLGVALDERLRETHGGAWQGLTNTEIRERYAGELEVWLRGGDIPAAGAETRTAVGRRVVAAIESGLERVPDDGTLVAVTHGGAARSAIGSLLGLPHSCWTALGPLSNCCWSVLEERDTGWRLLEHNAGSLPEPVLGDER
jgi:glucosyl-3-phosphoglycerate phosphatase